MSNRPHLDSHREQLLHLDAPLAAIERDVPSRIATTHIARARGLIRAAELSLSQALAVTMTDGSDALASKSVAA